MYDNHIPLGLLYNLQRMTTILIENSSPTGRLKHIIELGFKFLETC